MAIVFSKERPKSLWQNFTAMMAHSKKNTGGTFRLLSADSYAMLEHKPMKTPVIKRIRGKSTADISPFIPSSDRN